MPFVRAPFVKWAGGKRRLVPFIAEHLLTQTHQISTNEKLSKSSPAQPGPVRRLVEPFAGGAAVTLALADQFDGIWLNDVNADLMNLYSRLKDEPDEYIREAARLFTPETNAAEAYYRLRDEFNTTHSLSHKSALFLYLNRHGYNGLCRYNGSGQFNVPFGRYKNPYFPEAELRAAADVLPKTRLTSQDFEKVMESCGPRDVVYCDPPYVPLNGTASFTDYAAGGFDIVDQERLAAAAEASRQRGVLVAISNHDTEFTRALYREAECYYRQVRRTISCDGQNRDEVAEVLAVFKPVNL